MALAASVIVDRARRTLLDPAPGVTWTDADLLDYLSAAQNAVCQIKADAYPLRATVALAAGVAQALPSDALSLLDIYFNGNGATVNEIGRSLLNNVAAWPAATPRPVVTDWMSDQRDPRRFFVNPPNDGSGSLFLLYGAIPPRIANVSTNIALPDTYENALWAYMIALAYAENTTRQDLTKSQQWLTFFNALVVGRGQTQKINAPDLRLAERT
jgi:hypothetical protein